LPEGWALDRDGAPTVDPSEALLGAMLPFGGHKGSAIATMVELLAGVMIGDRTSPDVIDFLGTTTLAPVHGELIVSFSPSIFSEGRSGDVHARAETLFDAIMGQGARLPSQRRYAARATSDAVGIELTPEERASLDKLSSGAL
jgi:LDH2 family malate/lactate/ureidoglycolate dehydrogenase